MFPNCSYWKMLGFHDEANMAALRGNLSELSLFFILVLVLSYITSGKSYDGTAKDISSI